ncbi:phage tail sheath family protein [Kitasatospora purpeofusca]|uniref:phage tail sheath family protein n=1 Tax=Kitasatospora purpeofusca TaxID=67352 RepID=UPI002A5A0F5A|nr:phage tail sheath C-terminal domain-containing protein [Kitasatospora purpeofusca]MDY0815274.1 phage tail sheath C-terminal domain-containing protein [Kitasatospora purpeofusca]
MADSVNYPGVSLGDVSSSLSVSSGATAVPLFIADFGTAFEGVVRVDGWSELAEAAGEGATSGESGEVLRGYFVNGGGGCYLANTAGTTLQKVLASAESCGEVTILVPLGLWDGGADAAGETVRAVTAYAAAHQAMAVLHAGRDHTARDARDAARAFKLDADQSAHAALYHPWLIPPGAGAQPVPPVGAVAGVYCRVDCERGVWKAPANVMVDGGLRPSQAVTDTEQGDAQPVNILREFTGRGTNVWGARTLDETDPQWRFIPVRRLADTVTRDLQKALAPVAFEPNNQPMWEKLRAAADNYLHGIWRQGGLQGNSPQEAYFVQIGRGVTMTDEDVTAGRVVLKVGLAAVRPAEFIILTMTGTAVQV